MLLSSLWHSIFHTRRTPMLKRIEETEELCGLKGRDQLWDYGSNSFGELCLWNAPERTTQCVTQKRCISVTPNELVSSTRQYRVLCKDYSFSIPDRPHRLKSFWALGEHCIWLACLFCIIVWHAALLEGLQNTNDSKRFIPYWYFDEFCVECPTLGWDMVTANVMTILTIFSQKSILLFSPVGTPIFWRI